MRKEIFETGKSVDAAIETACEKLGCAREACEWEIIDLPKKGFLGLKNTPAKVRVSFEAPDEKPAPAPPQKTAPLKPAPIKPPPQPQAAPPSRPPRPEPRQEMRSEPRPEPRKEEKKPQSEPREEVSSKDLTEKETAAIEYLSQVLKTLELKANYNIVREHGGSCINIVGDNLGIIIGRRGETLDALQYLTGLVANRCEGEYLRLTVDCGDYRLKRKETLETLAKKLASQVLKTNISKTLEPMNPFERRIIHATVSEIEGVSSASIGEEPNRRVVITTPTSRHAAKTGFRDSAPRGERPDRHARPPREGNDRPARPSGPRVERGDRAGERGDFRGGRNNPRHGSQSRAPRQPASPVGPPKQTPEAEATNGISFGKIDLE